MGIRKGKSGLSDGPDRRQHARHGTEVVSCELGDVVELSRSGFRLVTKSKPPMRPKQVVNVTLRFDGRLVKVQAQARWIKRSGLRKHTMGLAFVNVSDKVGMVLESVAKYGFVCVDPAESKSTSNQGKNSKNKPADKAKVTIDLPNYYRLLEIDRDATDEQLRAAYRRMAQTYHPDANKSPDAASRFIEISQAYEVLSDPDRRKSYDAQAA